MPNRSILKEVIRVLDANSKFKEVWANNWPLNSPVFYLTDNNEIIESRISSEILESEHDNRLYVKIYGINYFVPISRLIPKNKDIQ